MGDLTRLGGILGGGAFRRMLRDRLGGVSSHDVGPAPRSRHPPGCLGDPDPMAKNHHRGCVIADRWERACAAGNCQYVDPTAMKPDPTKDCPGHRGERSIRHVQGKPCCVVTWTHCERRHKWGRQHETPKGPRRSPRLPMDERAPWDRDPGEDG